MSLLKLRRPSIRLENKGDKLRNWLALYKNDLNTLGLLKTQNQLNLSNFRNNNFVSNSKSFKGFNPFYHRLSNDEGPSFFSSEAPWLAWFCVTEGLSWRGVPEVSMSPEFAPPTITTLLIHAKREVISNLKGLLFSPSWNTYSHWTKLGFNNQNAAKNSI
jgi:hypothetical protein